MRALALITTLATRDDALRIGRALVERRLAACAQVTAIDSVYRWQGQVHQEPEFRLLLKTTEARYGALEQALLALHPYELPAIHALGLERAHPPYAAWIEAETEGE